MFGCSELKPSIVTLMNTCNDLGRDYVKNFIRDYFNLSELSMEKNFGCKKNVTEDTVKNFNTKIYHKSKKNRAQAVMQSLEDRNKIQYISKGRSVIFVRKINKCMIFLAD